MYINADANSAKVGPAAYLLRVTICSLLLLGYSVAGIALGQSSASPPDVSYDTRVAPPTHTWGVWHRGQLSVSGTSVQFSEIGRPTGRSFEISCADFRERSRFEKIDAIDVLTVPTGQGDFHLSDRRSGDDPKVGRIQEGILNACDISRRTQQATLEQQGDQANRERLKYRGVRISAGDPPDASYPVVHHAAKDEQGTLSASGLLVSYAEADNHAENFSFSCNDFSSQVQFVAGYSLRIGGRSFSDHFRGRKSGTGSFPSADQVYRGLEEHCRAAALAQSERKSAIAQLEEKERETQAKAAREAAEAQRQAAADEQRRRAEELRSSVLSALRAAEEPDPFASIRGEYNLAAPVSGRWKTTLVLPGAEECGLVKAAPAAPTLWAYGCLFRAPGFEDSVKFLQSALSLCDAQKFDPEPPAADVTLLRAHLPIC